MVNVRSLCEGHQGAFRSGCTPSGDTRGQISPHLRRFPFFSFFIVTVIPVSVEWYFVVGLICIFLRANGLEYLFTRLSAMCPSALEKRPLESFVRILIGLLILL